MSGDSIITPRTFPPGKLTFTGELTYTGKAETCTIKVPEPRKPLLSFYVNDQGKLDAEYAPENLTEAARALLTEMSRLQGIEVQVRGAEANGN